MTCVFKEYVQAVEIPAFYGMEFPSDAEMRQAHILDSSGNLDYSFKSAETVEDSTKYIYGHSDHEVYFVVDSDGKFESAGGDIPGSFFINICYEPVYMEGCKEKNGIVINPTETGVGGEYVGLSTDEKPAGVPKYSIYWELNTGNKYYFDGSSWNLIPSGGDGGIPTPEVTVTWKLSGVQPSDVAAIVFYGMAVKDGDEYKQSYIETPATTEGTITGWAVPTYDENDILAYSVQVAPVDQNNTENWFPCTLSDLVNCEDVEGIAVVTDPTQPFSFTATITPGE